MWSSMTIFDYDSLPTITVPYILRDVDNPSIGVWVTNQETKEKLFLAIDATSFFYDGFSLFNNIFPFFLY